jgi:L1 cell adhesion molecule like protein
MGPPPLGIDLGTTNLCAATVQNGHAVVIPNQLGNKLTPAYVAFTEFERLIGEPAKIQAAWNPENTVFETKRILGRKWEDVQVQQLNKYWPFEVKPTPDGSMIIECNFRTNRIQLRPEEITSMLLGKMKEIAESYLKKECTSAVVSAPAYFNDSQRQATCDAARIAGLQVTLISEPAAAALAYGRHKISPSSIRTVLVYDFGGGKLDVSILSIQKTKIEVLATRGDTTIGGDDFDIELVAYFANEFQTKNGKDVTVNASALRKLKAACEKAKRVLSTNTESYVVVDQLFHGLGFYSKLTRAQFEVICANIFRMAMRPVYKVLELARLGKEHIDDIIVIGGGSRIPKIQLQLHEFFGKPLCKGIDPDETVAIGASILSAILLGDIENLELVDVSPLTIGIEVAGGIVEHLIDRCGRLPIEVTRVFTTDFDNQKEIKVNVYEGNKALTKDNNLLGTFSIPGLTPAPRGQIQIPVVFKIDVNGILTVSTGNVQLPINKGRLTEGQIENMAMDWQEYAQSDEVIRKSIMGRNKLESYLVKVQRLVGAAQRGVLSEIDEQAVSLKCIEACRWLNESGIRTDRDFEKKLTELQSDIEPFLDVVRRSNPGIEETLE